MQAIPGEIQFVIAITLLLILITSFVIAFILIHQKHYHKYIQEKEELKNSYHQEILKAQLEMQEQTFRTISQEIHDNIGQVLSLVRLQISTVNPIDLSATEQKITSSKELLDQALDDLRNLSKQLNPEHVSRHPLSGLLRSQLDIIRKAGLHETHFEMHGEESPFDPGKKLIVFALPRKPSTTCSNTPPPATFPQCSCTCPTKPSSASKTTARASKRPGSRPRFAPRRPRHAQHGLPGDPHRRPIPRAKPPRRGHPYPTYAAND
jgi:hypothetical protein